MKKPIFTLVIVMLALYLSAELPQTKQEKLHDGMEGILPWETYQRGFSQEFAKTQSWDRDIIWDNWYDPFGADGYNVRPQMALCQDGGYAVTGYYVIQDVWGNYIEWLGYTLKADSEGNLLWADRDTLSFTPSVQIESYSIVETSDGSIISAGAGYMIKRDLNGNRIWSRPTDFSARAMINSSDNTIVMTGTSFNGDLLIRKMDEDGTEIWNKDVAIGEYNTNGLHVIKTSDNGFAIAGYKRNEQYRTDILTVKTNELGDTLWSYSYNYDDRNDRVNWLLENSDNELLVVAEVRIPGSVRGYIAKLSLDGELLYENILDPQNGYNCWYTIDLPEENAYLVTAVPNMIKFDYDFNIIWVEYMSTLLNYYHKLPDGYIFYSNGVHLMRTDDNIVSTIDETIPEHEISIGNYPNPFNPSTTLSFDVQRNNSCVNLSVFNMKGQKIATLIDEKKNQGKYSIPWNAQNNASGVYLFRLKIDQNITTTKSILLK